MLLLTGTNPTVQSILIDNRQVWTSGVFTPYNVLHTYMDRVILHATDKLPDWDLHGVYVIVDGNPLLREEAVARGAFCISASLEQGLYRLRDLLRI